jgi:nucleotide-binding universal stress UspA family protein
MIRLLGEERMIPYRNILIPTDGSDNTKPAIYYALNLANKTGANVAAICVNDTSNYAVASNDAISDADSIPFIASKNAVDYVVEQGRGMGLDVTPSVVNGLPAKEIVEISKEYDLIVMGTVGRTGIVHMLLGSVAEKVVRLASCPVLVVNSVQSSGFNCRKILIPTDGSDNTKPAIEHGLLLAKMFNAEVTAFSVDPVKSAQTLRKGAGSEERPIDAGQEAVDHVVDEGRKFGIEVRPQVVSGSPSDEIIKLSSHYDMVVMGTHGRTGLEHLRLGSVAERVVRQARCPVLVVGAKQMTSKGPAPARMSD